jgi:hypothetical protein
MPAWTCPSRSDERNGFSGREVDVDVGEREGALWIGEVQAADLQVQRSARDAEAAYRLGLGLEHRPQPGQRPETGLQVRQVPSDLVDLPDERGRDKEQRDELCGRQVVPRDEEGARDGGEGEQRVQQCAGPATDLGRALTAGCDPGVHDRGQLGDPAYEIGLTETRAQVVARGDALFHDRRVIGPGDLLGELPPGDLRGDRTHEQHGQDADEREQHPRRPPRESRDDPHRHSAEQGAREVPDHPPEQVAELVRVVVHPVENLADGLL